MAIPAGAEKAAHFASRLVLPHPSVGCRSTGLLLEENSSYVREGAEPDA